MKILASILSNSDAGEPLMSFRQKKVSEMGACLSLKLLSPPAGQTGFTGSNALHLNRMVNLIETVQI